MASVMQVSCNGCTSTCKARPVSISSMLYLAGTRSKNALEIVENVFKGDTVNVFCKKLNKSLYVYVGGSNGNNS